MIAHWPHPQWQPSEARVPWKHHYRQGKTCTVCAVPITDANETGFCIAHMWAQHHPVRKHHRLTREDAQAIRRRFADGTITVGHLAGEYGVSKATIHDVLAGRTWKPGEP